MAAVTAVRLSLVKGRSTSKTLTFVAASFRSAWSVELLCLLRTERDRSWLPGELVRGLRASELVVQQGVEALSAAGLVVVGPSGEVRYAAPPQLEETVAAVERLYRTAPDSVRRAIVRGNSPTEIAFSNAFKLRGDD